MGALPWVVLWLFIVRSRLLVYSAGSGVNRVQVVLSYYVLHGCYTGNVFSSTLHLLAIWFLDTTCISSTELLFSEMGLLTYSIKFEIGLQ